MNEKIIKPVAPYIQLQYLSRIKSAVKAKDSKMLAALYAQCEQLNIAVPHYEIAVAPECKEPRNPRDFSCAQGFPAIEILPSGKVRMRMLEDLVFNGETKPLKEWLKIYNISCYAFRNRIQYGWGIENALTAPKKG